MQSLAQGLLAACASATSQAQGLSTNFLQANRPSVQYHWRQLAKDCLLDSLERPSRSGKPPQLPPYESDLSQLVSIPATCQPCLFLFDDYLEWQAREGAYKNSIDFSEQIGYLQAGSEALLTLIGSPIGEKAHNFEAIGLWREEFPQMYEEDSGSLTLERAREEWLGQVRRGFEQSVPDESLAERFGVYDSLFCVLGVLRRAHLYDTEIRRFQGQLQVSTPMAELEVHLQWATILQNRNAEFIEEVAKESRLELLYDEPSSHEAPVISFQQLVRERILQQLTSSSKMCLLEEMQEGQRKRLKDLLSKDAYEEWKADMEHSEQAIKACPSNDRIGKGRLAALLPQKRPPQIAEQSHQKPVPCMTFERKRRVGSDQSGSDSDDTLRIPLMPPQLSDIKSVGDLEQDDLLCRIESYGRVKDKAQPQQEQPRLVMPLKQVIKPVVLNSHQELLIKPKQPMTLNQINKRSPSTAVIPQLGKPSPIQRMSHRFPRIDIRMPQPSKPAERLDSKPLQHMLRSHQQQPKQNSFYPFCVWPAVITAESSYIAYYFSSINEKQLCLTFLIDRIKAQVNTVKILATSQQIEREGHRLFKYVTALTLLGAQVRVQCSNRTCEAYNRQEFWVVRAVASVTGRPLQETVRRLRLAGWPPGDAASR